MTPHSPDSMITREAEAQDGSFSEVKTESVAARENTVSGHDSPSGSESHERAPASPKDRTRKHRAKIQDQNRCRLEVCIDRTLSERVCKITRQPMWVVVQRALEAHVEEHSAIVAEGQRLEDERACLLRQADAPAKRHLVDEFNRKLDAFNARVQKFYGSNS